VVIFLNTKKSLIYENPLSAENDIKDFILEGSAKFTFSNGRLRMQNSLNADLGQKANFVLWCNRNFPSNIEVQWDFWPISEPGLCILFFSAKGINGEDIFDPKLNKRTGEYDLYHHGDISAFHVSYFRRMWKEERSFHTCNLRKSFGFHLVSQGADPIPSVEDSANPYHMRLVKLNDVISFYINDLLIFEWEDDGETFGPGLTDGKIGFRQMAPLVAEYSGLKVFSYD
jgi:Domain of unknown function (DUF1961).